VILFLPPRPTPPMVVLVVRLTWTSKPLRTVAEPPSLALWAAPESVADQERPA
jgi:hypothetical protein